MSTPQGIDVNKDSNMGQIQEALNVNGAMINQTAVTENVAVVEKQKAVAQETEATREAGSSSLSSRASSTSSSLKSAGSNRAGLYADLAMEASGVGAVSQMGKTVMDLIKDRYDPAGGMGINTFDDLLSGKAAKPKTDSTAGIFGGGKSIKTKHSFDLASKGNLTGDALRGDTGNTKSWGGMNQTSSELHKRVELACSAKLVNAKLFGHAKQAEMVVGAKIAKAQQFGIAPSLVQDRMKHGPKFYEPKDEINDDGATSWA